MPHGNPQRTHLLKSLRSQTVAVKLAWRLAAENRADDAVKSVFIQVVPLLNHMLLLLIFLIGPQLGLDAYELSEL